MKKYAMSSERYKILEFNQYKESDKMPHVIYVDIESLIKKIDGCANNLENSSAIKIYIFFVYIPCGYSVTIIGVFDHI